MTDQWSLHWLEAAQPFPLHLRNRIIADLHAAQTILEARMPLPRLDITLAPRPARWCIPQYGLGGFATHETSFNLVFDLESEALPRTMKDGALQRMALHEINHCLRAAAHGLGTTLGDALVNEGLAGQFVRLLTGCPPEPWEDAVSQDDIKAHMPNAEELSATQYAHADWFFGQGNLPHWLGYTLGYQTVGAYCAARGISDPADLLDPPTQDVLAFLPSQDGT